jgi:hypothetical protein
MSNDDWKARWELTTVQAELSARFFLQKIEQNSRSITPALLVGSTVHYPRGHYGTSIVTLKQGSKFFPLTVHKLNQLHPVKS